MLTDTEIKKAIREATAERTLNDQKGGRGAGSLRLRIRPSATGTSATWLAFWKQGSERATKPLGRYPETTAAQARTIYQSEIVPQLLAGRDPRVVVVEAERPTVARLFGAYVANMRAAGKDSADEVERQLLTAKGKGSAAAALGKDRAAGDVEPGEVADYLAKFYRRGSRGQGDKARAYMHAAFNWALMAANDYTVKERQDWGLSRNPVALVARDKGARSTRERNLTADELRALWLAAEPGRNGFTLETGAAVRLLIGTGQRVQEVLRIDGAELDLDAALWRMPREKTKTKKRAHLVPLPAIVLPVLRQLAAERGAGPLFPARTGSKAARMDHRSVMQAIDRWRALPDVSVAHFQTRDIRRTWKSRAGDGARIDRETRDLIQQHARTDTGSKHYDIADYLPQMREGMDKWQAWLAALVDGKKAGG